MTREQLEHLIKRCSQVIDRYEVVVIGSQSILGSIPFPPDDLTVSMEADVWPIGENEDDLVDLIDGAIGEGSPFHEMHGYYAQGVDSTTATLPQDWESRVHKIQNEHTDLRVGRCLDVVDLFLSKAYANRDKDRDFCIALFVYKYVQPEDVLALVSTMPINQEAQRALRARIQRWADRASMS